MCCYKIRVSIYVAESLKHSKHRKLLWGNEGNINIWKFHLGRAIRVRRHAAKIKGVCNQRGDSACRHKAAPPVPVPALLLCKSGRLLPCRELCSHLAVPFQPPKTCHAHRAPVVLPCDCSGVDHLRGKKPQLSLCHCQGVALASCSVKAWRLLLSL